MVIGMNNVVITIARQYGSGGRTIGEMLAKKLNVHYYDKELMKLASDDSGINEALFVNADEKVKNTSLFHIARKEYHGELIPPESDDFTSTDNLFNYQAKIIRDLAKEESCVIIGRCADYVLKDYPNVLSVFIHAPKEYCLEGAAKKHSMSPKELERFINKTDKHRAEYYKYHTGREWTDARNYDLCLDSSKLGYERCVDEIISYLKVRFPANYMYNIVKNSLQQITLQAVLLSVKAEYTEHSAKDLAVIDDDGIHGVVLRLETDMSLLLVECLDRSGIINQSYDNLAVMCCVLSMYEDTVAVKNTGIDHGFSTNIQNEGFSLGNYIGGNGEVVLNILLSEDRLSGSNIADDREAYHLGTYHLETVITDLNGTGLGRVSADVAVLLQSL